EHTSELQSRRDLVCRLLLEKSSDVCSDRKSTRLNSSHVEISYAVFCLNKEQTCALRSEEHTSELQLRRDLVCRLLLVKTTPCSASRCRTGCARWRDQGRFDARRL